MPPKINFVERNKQNIASKKTAAVKKEVVDKDSGASKDKEKENKPVRTSSAATSRPRPLAKTNSSRPVSAPVKPKSALTWHGIKRKPSTVTETPDIVTSLIRRGIQEVLLKIFLPLDNTTLTACRQVSKSWHRYLKNVFWRENRARAMLSRRLSQNWNAKSYFKTDMKVAKGIGCKRKCAENFRECKCGEKLQCQVIGDFLILDFGGSELVAEYCSKRVENGWKNSEESRSSTIKRFDIEQHQLKFNLQNGLSLETSDWLSTAVFLNSESCKRKLIKYKDYTVSLHPAEANTILIRDSKSKELIQKTLLYNQTGDLIQDIQINEGRLSAVIGDNKVIVYDFEKLLSGATRVTATILIHDEPTAAIHYHYLRYNFLLLVHGVTVTLYNFWKYTPTSEVKDFIL